MPSKAATLVFIILQVANLALLSFNHWQWSNSNFLLCAGSIAAAASALVLNLAETRNFSKRLDTLFENVTKLKTNHIIQKLDGDDEIAKINKELGKVGQEIAEAERREKSILERAADLVCTIDLEGNFTSINPAVLKMWGYSPEEVLGKSLSNFVLPDDKEASLQALMGAEKSLDTSNFENRIKHKDGSVLDILWSAHWSAADRALFCIAHDISERKRIERMLEESEARLQTIFSSLPIGLLIVNQIGIVEMTNPSFELLSGFKREELVGKQISNTLLKNDVQFIEKNLGKLVDLSVISQSGKVINAQLSSTELVIKNKKKFLLAFVDISEREKLEQLKQAFFAMVSHDLRSPLTSLLSMLDTLGEGKMGELSEDGQKMVEKNAKETSRLINLVNELLDIEKMRAGQFELIPDRIKIDTVVDSAFTAISGMASNKSVELHYAPSQTTIVADQSLLIRVLVNLLSNAIKFSPANSRVEVTCSENEGEVKLSVLDSGTGVPDEFKEKIFDLFQQAENQEVDKRGGTGLGLSICKMIVEQHEGKIWVESQQGQGSKFSFVLPKKKLFFEDFD